MCRRSRSMIGRISRLLISGRRTGILDAALSPKSLGMKNYDHQGGVGLGLVTNLEKSSKSGGEILGKYGLRSPVPNRPVTKSEVSEEEWRRNGIGGEFEENLEDFTYVTFHRENRRFTRVYCDGIQCDDQTAGDTVCSGVEMKKHGLFTVSPVRDSPESVSPLVCDFLNRCHLCKKSLQGRDIYMYRGEKAFCSEECRQRQMVNEELKERRRFQSSKSREVSGSACKEGREVFNLEILVI